MKIVFMGTMEFAVPILEELAKHHEVVQVVTQPDRPAGRKQELKPSPVKRCADRLGIPCFQPEKIRKDHQSVLDAQPELIVVAAFGQMIPKVLLGYPKYHCINVHASMLPKYRGGSPMHRAIANGDVKTGVTVMYMAEKMDTGQILGQREEEIRDLDDVGQIEKRLAEQGRDLLMEVLPKVFDGTIVPWVQDESQASYAWNIKHEEELLDFSKTAKQVYDQVRGFFPWPVASTTIDGFILKINRVGISPDPSGEFAHRQNGEIVLITKSDVFVKVADGLIALKDVQLAGKKAMDIKSFMNGAGKNILSIGKILK